MSFNKNYEFFKLIANCNYHSNNNYQGEGGTQLYQSDLVSGKSNWSRPFLRRNSTLLLKYVNPCCENWFTVNSMKSLGRNITDIAGLDCLFCDLDSVKIGHESPWDTYDKLKGLIDDSELLDPTAIVFSGHGLHVYWIFNHQVTVHNRKAVTMWEDVEKYLVQHKLVKLGLPVDTGVCDPSRILRVPGSYNTKDFAKTGNIQDKHLVFVKDLNPKFVYDFNDLLKLYHKESHNDFVKKLHKMNAKHNNVHVSNQHWGDWDHEKMAEQLFDLVKMRQGKVNGLRNFILHMYSSVRMFANRRAKFVDTDTQNKVKGSIIDGVEGLNYLFENHLPKSELNRFIHRIRISKFNISPKETDICKYNYSQKRIVKQLQITKHEQECLSRLRSDSVKKSIRKDRDRKRAKARYYSYKHFQDKVHYQKHLQQGIRLEHKVNQMIYEKKHGWTYKQIANKNDCSISKVYHLIKAIGYTNFSQSYPNTVYINGKEERIITAPTLNFINKLASNKDKYVFYKSDERRRLLIDLENKYGCDGLYEKKKSYLSSY